MKKIKQKKSSVTFFSTLIDLSRPNLAALGISGSVTSTQSLRAITFPDLDAQDVRIPGFRKKFSFFMGYVNHFGGCGETGGRRKKT